MKFSAAVCVVLAGAGLLRSQGAISSHSGWSIQDTLETASHVVIGVPAASDCSDTGTQVFCQATLRVIRSLKGDIAPEAEIRVRWSYHATPMDGPDAAQRVPAVTAMWFLRTGVQGEHEVLVCHFMGPYGGVYLQVPGSQPGGDLFYTGDAAPEYKIAREAAAALMAAAPAVDRQLGEQARFVPGSPEARQTSLDRVFFESLAMLLRELPPESTAAVYVSLSHAVSANVAVTGLAGRLRARDAGALIDLERELPRFSATPGLHEIGMSAGALDLKNRPDTAQILARLALSEIEIPALEMTAAVLLPATNSLAVLPTLAAMLHNPETSVHGAARAGICVLLRSAKFWDDSMQANCPDASSSADPREQEYVRFWIEWWQSRRPQIPELADLRDVPLPVRYARAALPPMETVEVPMEMRFSMLVSMSSTPSHYHVDGGEYREGPPPGPADPFAARMSTGDYAAYLEVVREVSKRLDGIQDQLTQIMSRARFTGGRPDVKNMQALGNRRTEALNAGLEALRNKLSPEGWGTFEQFLREMNIHGGRMGGPPQ